MITNINLTESCVILKICVSGQMANQAEGLHGFHVVKEKPGENTSQEIWRVGGGAWVRLFCESDSNRDVVACRKHAALTLPIPEQTRWPRGKRAHRKATHHVTRQENSYSRLLRVYHCSYTGGRVTLKPKWLPLRRECADVRIMFPESS